jgi:hypothetical protein
MFYSGLFFLRDIRVVYSEDFFNKNTIIQFLLSITIIIEIVCFIYNLTCFIFNLFIRSYFEEKKE